MTDLFARDGRRIPLGKKLGSGGEGAVYEIPTAGSDVVAKVYHAIVGHEKQMKLAGMAQGSDEALKKIAAWPMGTLHSSSGGPVRGFLMPKVSGSEPIHHLYSPSHRKQRHPDKDWGFLVNTARNMAAAFETIHGHGHVIGDVNPNLVFVAGNSVVKLIDCDSFQIVASGKHYLCEVGVPHFTPPELQGHSTFRGLRRTINHDNFGLAILIFHVLLMGRHPFSGVYSGSGDMPLEKAIAQFRYAFGRNATSKGMAPPPNSVTPAILPGAIATLFERAFTEQGAQPDGRPLAREWVAELDSLRGQLRTCGQETVHKYFGGLPSCPWCAQEQHSGICFFISLVPAAGGSGTFSLGQAWARIMAVDSPGGAPAVNLTAFQVRPKPLPPEAVRAKTVAFIRKAAAVAIFVGCLVFWPAGFMLAMIVSGILFFGGETPSSEKRVRQAALDTARNDLNAVQHRWNTEGGDGKFQAKVMELAGLRKEYEGLANQLASEKEKLQQNLRNAQLHKFLDRFFISDHAISGIGLARKATLASFGIETAADVTKAKITRIRGFGPSLADTLVDWRTSLERRFVFDPTKGVDPADTAALNQRFSQKRKQLEGSILAGHEQLVQIRRQILQQRSQLLPVLNTAATRVAQAQADLSVV